MGIIRGVTQSAILDMGVKGQIPYDPIVLAQEFRDLADHITAGGRLGGLGPIEGVRAVHVGITLLIYIEAPQTTWDMLQPVSPQVDVPRGTRKERRKAKREKDKAEQPIDDGVESP